MLTALGGVCFGEVPIGGFEASNFEPQEPVTVCFDLSVPSPPKVGVLVKLPSRPEVLQRSVLLPFPAKSIDQNKDGYVTGGSFNGLTLINFINTPGIPTSLAISVSPVPDDVLDGDFFRSGLPGVLYLMESGLKRRFVYKLNAVSAVARGGNIAKLPVEPIDTVAVRLPVGAEVFESRKDAAIAVRDLSLGNTAVRHFAAANTGSPDAHAIDIVYQLQPTKLQNILFEYGLKLFGALLIPLLGIVLLTSAQVKRRRRLRKLILWIGGVVEVVLLALLLWWSFRVKSVTGWAALLEVIVAILGLLATAAVAFLKEET